MDAVLHEGACSDTMEHNGRFMLDNNYRNSKDPLDACQAQGTRLLYASSAATYGGSDSFREEPEFEQPLNVYGYSKLLFDNVVRRMLPSATAQVVGFRYFNVYGPREQHKARMASVAFHHFNQFRDTGKVRLFGEYGGYAQGEQSRDFVFVNDVVAVNLWFLQHPDQRGIFNLGTGRAQPFNDVAVSTVNAVRALRGEAALPIDQLIAHGLLEYIDFPDALKGKYQCFTQADLTRLRHTGCDHRFADVATGIASYVTPSTWGNDAGMVGALTLATKALEQQRATEKSAGKSAGGIMAASGLGERGLLVAGLVVAVLAVAAMRSR